MSEVTVSLTFVFDRCNEKVMNWMPEESWIDSRQKQ